MTGKLVRDKIPELIVKNGGNPSTRILNDEEYLAELDKKLQEEVEQNDLAELGDVLEVIRAIAEIRGNGINGIEEIREQKFHERGGFKEKVFLNKV